METTFGLRLATDTDAGGLAKLATQTFFDSWQQYNSKEDMQSFVDTHFSEENLKKQIQQADTFYLITSDESEDIGYLKLKKGNPKKLFIDPDAAEIEKLYVLSKYQSNGVGNILIEVAESFANQYKYNVLWLSVWKPNLRAMSFYQRLGFKICGEQEFLLGNDVQYDFLMKKNIT